MYTKTKAVRKDRAAQAEKVRKESWWAPHAKALPMQKIAALDKQFGVGVGAFNQRMRYLAEADRINHKLQEIEKQSKKPKK
jgi:hypothetical protein